MKYYPGLIRPEMKVLPHYFKGEAYIPTKENKLLLFLWYISSICFFLVAFASIRHVGLALLLAIIGFILLPQGHQAIEKHLRFHLTTIPKLIACAILFIGIFPMTSHYTKADRIETAQLKVRMEEEAKVKAEEFRKNQVRLDSLSHYLQTGKDLIKSHHLAQSLQTLSYASIFAASQAEKNTIDQQVNIVNSIQANEFIKTGNYQKALPLINNLLAGDANNVDLRYQRALCYSKTGRIQEAVEDLKVAKNSDNVQAEKLYNKINPVKRRIVGYVTRCCDGSTSYSSGRGTCSHHGGVCNWNDPIYEESRKYE